MRHLALEILKNEVDLVKLHHEDHEVVLDFDVQQVVLRDFENHRSDQIQDVIEIPFGLAHEQHLVVSCVIFYDLIGGKIKSLDEIRVDVLELNFSLGIDVDFEVFINNRRNFIQTAASELSVLEPQQKLVAVLREHK